MRRYDSAHKCRSIRRPRSPPRDQPVTGWSCLEL